MKFCILLSFFLTTSLVQEKGEATPKALFSIMLWNTQEPRLAYAPWGNENEGNATIVPLRYPTVPSRKCSFYGDGELNVLGKKNPMNSRRVRTHMNR